MHQSWQSELEKVWLRLEIPEFLSKVGVDFEETFICPLRASNLQTNPYQNHTWLFFRLDRLPPGVLHASPKQKVGQEPALWEEWFIEDSVNHHHALRNSSAISLHVPAQTSLLNWRSPSNDSEHPLEVMDVDWHYFNDADQRPYLLR